MKYLKFSLLSTILFFLLSSFCLAGGPSTNIIDSTNPSDAPKVLDTYVNKKFDMDKPTFEGYSIPNALVTIYLYSKPIVGNTYTDETGFWKWTSSESLPAGIHVIQATVTDSQGHISLASAPIKFEILNNNKKFISTILYIIATVLVIFTIVMIINFTQKKKVS